MYLPTKVVINIYFCCHIYQQSICRHIFLWDLFSNFAVKITSLHNHMTIRRALGLCWLLLTSISLWANEFVVVIDPGHGGKDAGAVGSKAKEKDINLGVALQLGDLIKKNMKDVKVVYTRSTDVFIPLQERADIANRASGDLFISIHTNSVDLKSRNRSTAAGASVYTLGFKKSEENLAVAMRENSVIKLEEDYTTTYQGFDPSSAESYIIFEMSQNMHMEQSIQAAMAVQNELISSAGRKDRGVRQANFWVLFKTAMPSMLIELDFISNPQSEKYLASSAGQKSLAKAIFNGVKAYKTSTERQGATSATVAQRSSTTAPLQDKKEAPSKRTSPSQSSTTASSSPTPKGAVVYKIQFLTAKGIINQGDSRLKGLAPVEYYVEGKIYKYTFGAYASTAEAQKALPKIRKKFADAFIIKTVDGQRVK